MADQGTAVLKDRSTGLTVFGVIEVVMGILTALFIALIIPSLRIVRQEQFSLPPYILIYTLLFYVSLAVFWIIMGIGSIKATRWARAIILIVSWLWLIYGVIGSIGWFLSIPNMTRMMNEMSKNMPGNFTQIIILVQGIFILFLLIILPLIFVLFYRSPSVKSTVERLDPKVRWTDRCPLPVLALSLFQIVGALQMVMMIGMGIGMPVFGKFIEGLPMVILTVGITAILLYLAWANYHLRPAGWYGTLILLILGTVSSFVTFKNFDMTQMYIKMGYQGKMLEMMQKQQTWSPNQMTVWMIICTVVFLGFLWYIRRYYKPAFTV